MLLPNSMIAKKAFNRFRTSNSKTRVDTYPRIRAQRENWRNRRRHLMMNSLSINWTWAINNIHQTSPKPRPLSDSKVIRSKCWDNLVAALAVSEVWKTIIRTSAKQVWAPSNKPILVMSTQHWNQILNDMRRWANRIRLVNIQFSQIGMASFGNGC